MRVSAINVKIIMRSKIWPSLCRSFEKKTEAISKILHWGVEQKGICVEHSTKLRKCSKFWCRIFEIEGFWKWEVWILTSIECWITFIYVEILIRLKCPKTRLEKWQKEK